MEPYKNNYIFDNDKHVAIRTDGRPVTCGDMAQAMAANPGSDFYTETANSLSVIGIKNGGRLPEGLEWATLRSQFATLDEASTFPLARAKALLEWRRDTVHCGRCGTTLDESKTQTAMECPRCGNVIFPRINPCVIVLVKKGDQILLARHAQRNQDVYSCLAGFVEAGETIEQAVHREIMEETGIKVKSLKYYGSQSWPFPSQLMFGFTAEYDGGDIKPQPDEIADAAWFGIDSHPATPPEGSIAYKLIHS